MHLTPQWPHLPDGLMFFTIYPPNVLPHPFHHPNTARGLKAVWIVVKDMDDATSDLQALGWPVVGKVKSKRWGGVGREFAVGHDTIILLRPNGRGPAADFERQRGQGIMGVTVNVDDLSQAQATAERNTDRRFAVYHGQFWRSFMIPAELASGCWIEMSQR